MESTKCRPTDPALTIKPDIIIRGNGKGSCMLIDVAILGDGNVINKKAEKILKY